MNAAASGFLLETHELNAPCVCWQTWKAGAIEPFFISASHIKYSHTPHCLANYSSCLSPRSSTHTLAASGGMPCQLVWKIDFYGLSCASSVTTTTTTTETERRRRRRRSRTRRRRWQCRPHWQMRGILGVAWGTGEANRGREGTNPAGVPFCVSLASFKRHLPVILCRVWHSFPRRNFSLANNASGWADKRTDGRTDGTQWSSGHDCREWQCH